MQGNQVDYKRLIFISSDCYSVIGCCNIAPCSCYCLIINTREAALAFRAENQQLDMRKLRLQVSNSTNLQWRQAALLRALLDIWFMCRIYFLLKCEQATRCALLSYTMHYAANSNWFENSCLKSLEIHFLGFTNLKFTGGHAPRLPSKLQFALP